MFLQKSFATSPSINFIQADYPTIAKLSALENKYFFVNYSAGWCVTCRVMEETCNANPELIHFIDEKFIAVKADVDTPQGKRWKDKYGVTCLPTLIVFSPDGQEVARKNGAITSSEFLVLLQQFETMPSQPVAVNVKPTAAFKTSTYPNSDANTNNSSSGYNNTFTDSNSSSTYSNNAVTNANNSSSGYNNTFTESNGSSNYSNISITISNNSSTGYNNTVSNDSSMDSKSAVTNSISNSEFTSKGTSFTNTSTSKNYGVQVGMYSDLSIANHTIDKLKKQSNQPVILKFQKVKGQNMYQVIVGEYLLEQEAIQFMSSLNSKGIKGLLIKL